LKLKGRTLDSKSKKQCLVYGEANVTYFSVKGTEGCGGIPFSPKGL
jgi:hypothetical protein